MEWPPPRGLPSLSRLWRRPVFEDLPLEHEYHRLGNTHYRLGRFDHAVEQYTKAIGANPRMVESYFNRALAHARLGKYSDALRDASRVIELKGGCDDGYYLRGRVWELSLDDGSAIADFEHAIELNPRHTGAAEHLRVIRSLRHVYRELRMYRSRIEDQPDNGYLHFQLGKRLAEIGHHDDAVRSLEAARTSGYATAELWLELGQAYSAQANPIQAMTAFRQAIHHDPTLVAAHAHLGQLLNESGHFRDSIEIFQQALSMPNEDEASLQCGLGFALAGLDRLDDAQAAFTRAQDLRENLREASLGLGRIAWRRGDLDLAWSHCGAVLRQDPPVHGAAVLAVNIALEQDRTGTAIGMAVEAFERAPDDPQTAYLLWSLASCLSPGSGERISGLWAAHDDAVERARQLVRDHVTSRRALDNVRRDMSERLIESCPIAEEAAGVLYQRLASARRETLCVLYSELHRPGFIPAADLLRRAARHAEKHDRFSIVELCDAYVALLNSSPEVPHIELVVRILERLTLQRVRHADTLYEFYRTALDALRVETVEGLIDLRPRLEQLVLASARDGFLIRDAGPILVDVVSWLDTAERTLECGTETDWDELAGNAAEFRSRLARTINPPEEWALSAIASHAATLMRHHKAASSG